MLVSGPAAGGIRVHLWQLLAGLPAHGVTPLLAAPPSLAGPAGALRVELPLGERLDPLRDLGRVRQLAAVARDWRPDLVHAHGYKAGMAATVAGGAPLVLTLHNLWPPAAGGLARLGVRLTLRATRSVIGVSRAVVRSVERVAGPLPNAHVIPNAIDPDHFSALPDRTTARRALGIGPEARVVGFAGRLTPVKGAQVLLQAATRLAVSQPGLVLLLAGDGPQRPELAAMQHGHLAHGLELRLTGAVPDVRLLLAAADAWAIPSLQEGGGIIALEAMAAGLPIVATTAGGLVEALAHDRSALLVPPGDVDALGTALGRVLSDGCLAHRLGAAAAADVRAHADLGSMVTQVVAVYRAVLEQAGRR